MTTLRKVAVVLGFVLGVFFIIRALVELVTIDYSDPSSYANDWGGPSLAGVLLVHCGLGVVSAVAIGLSLRRRRQLRTAGSPRTEEGPIDTRRNDDRTI